MGWFNNSDRYLEREKMIERIQAKIGEKLNEHFGQDNLSAWNIYQHSFEDKFIIDLYWTTEKLNNETHFKCDYSLKFNNLLEKFSDEEFNNNLDKMLLYLSFQVNQSLKIHKKHIYEDEFMKFLYSKYECEFIDYQLKNN